MKKSDAIAYYLNIEGLAEVLDVSVQAIHQWPEELSSNRAYELNDLSGGNLRYQGKFSSEQREQAHSLHELAVANSKFQAKKKS